MKVVSYFVFHELCGLNDGTAVAISLCFTVRNFFSRLVDFRIVVCTQ